MKYSKSLITEKYFKNVSDLISVFSIKNPPIIGFTNGCFDIIHIGHLDYLKKCKDLCDFLIVAVNSDNSVRTLKGLKRPINNLHDRIKFLSYLDSIDYIISFDDETPIELIKIIKPNLLFKGGDYTQKHVVGYELLKKYGGKVKILPFIEGYSSTNIVKKIIKNYEN